MKRDTLISWDYFYDSTLYTWLLALDCILNTPLDHLLFSNKDLNLYI